METCRGDTLTSSHKIYLQLVRSESARTRTLSGGKLARFAMDSTDDDVQRGYREDEGNEKKDIDNEKEKNNGTQRAHWI